jgi:hypothetical protein
MAKLNDRFHDSFCLAIVVRILGLCKTPFDPQPSVQPHQSIVLQGQSLRLAMRHLTGTVPFIPGGLFLETELDLLVDLWQPRDASLRMAESLVLGAGIWKSALSAMLGNLADRGT